MIRMIPTVDSDLASARARQRRLLADMRYFRSTRNWDLYLYAHKIARGTRRIIHAHARAARNIERFAFTSRG